MYHKISPFFSIIIPCYNQAHFLPDCLDSLLAQDFPDWEAIVVNDGSTDTTTEIALSYTQKDTRIKLVEKVNGGNRTVPTLVFSDGTAMTNPSAKQVTEKLAAL